MSFTRHGTTTPIEHWRTQDAKGMTMPWYTRACCDWLTTLDLRGKHVFEYGSGQSAHWWREQGCYVAGVDHQKEWAEMAGVRWQTDQDDYIAEIDEYGKFDIVCIDGEFRDFCTEIALNFLEEDGFIIIDNWKQGSCDLSEWPNTDALIEKCGLKTKTYYEPGHPDWCTLVISR